MPERHWRLDLEREIGKLTSELIDDCRDLPTVRDGPGRPQAPTVPGYEVLGEIARGGMGVVFKAHQVRADRPVALKMIRSGADAGAEELARFRTEAAAAARLQHPHIVQVYEVGEHDGRLFFSLELCEGGSLAQKLAGTPQAPRQAAEWVETLARAVQYAHQKGVIHRDLKPANVLLTADGALKVGDFGLAKHIHQDRGDTQTGAILGTPNYMAPEQAEGKVHEVGPLADVYALGAILYECLTGNPPFKGTSVLDTLEQVRTAEPVSVRELQPKVPRDLETICLKCLQKAPRKRYASAMELADDLRRFLDGQPIRARPVGAGERLVKWARRRPVLASLAAGIVVGLAVATWQWVRAETALAAEKHQQTETLAALEQVTREQKQTAAALATAKEHRRRWSLALIEMSSSFVYPWMAQQPGLRPAQKQYLERLAVHYGKLVAVTGDEPEVQHGAARAWLNLGVIQYRLGRMKEAKEAYQQSRALFNQLAQQFPATVAYRYDLAKAEHNLALVMDDTGQTKEAEQLLRSALKLQELAAGPPDDPKEQHEYAKTMVDLAAVLGERGPEEGLKLVKRATTLHDELARRHPEEPDYRRTQATAHFALGKRLHQLGQWHDAKKAYEKAVDVLRKLTAEFRNEATYWRFLARSLNGLGLLQKDKYQLGEADKTLLAAVNVSRSLVAAYPVAPDLKSELGASLHNAALVWLVKDNYRLPFLKSTAGLKQARLMFTEAADHQRKALEINPINPTYLKYLRNHTMMLTETHLRLGDHAEAAREAAKLPPLYPDKWDEYHRAVKFLAKCAALARSAGDPLSAEKHVRQAIEVLRPAVRGKFCDIAALKNEWAFVPLRQSKAFQKFLSELPPQKAP
jgi:tetratricopeptide (TPR) repeat protein